jgi:predicted TIM-barrel enzyme
MLEMRKPLIIGAVHLPFYGRCNPATSMAQLEEYVIANCRVFFDNGIDTLYIQDENMSPGKATEETIAVTAALGRLVKREIPSLRLGIIVEAHDGAAPIAVAHACGADFVRIKVFAGAMLKSTGVQQACGIEAVQYRTAIGANIAILADCHDRTGHPLAPVPIGIVTDWACRIGADAIILTGMCYMESLDFLVIGRSIAGNRPLLIGGGVTANNIREVLQHADGAVVSRSLMLDKKDENSDVHWDADKIRRFMDIARG